MRGTRRLAAFVSGLALYSAAICLSKFLADRHLPFDFTATLGGPDSWVVAMVESILLALPLFMLAFAWTYATMYPPRSSRRPATAWSYASRYPQKSGRRYTTAWCISGLGLAWFAWIVYGIFELSANPSGQQLSLTRLLLFSTAPPLWGLINNAAILAGAVFGGGLTQARAKPAAVLRAA